VKERYARVLAERASEGLAVDSGPEMGAGKGMGWAVGADTVDTSIDLVDASCPLNTSVEGVGVNEMDIFMGSLGSSMGETA